MGIASLWSALPAPHRRWILVNALGITALINLVVNAAIAWLSVSGQTDVPMWARPFSTTSTIADTLGTLFVLPLITCVLCTTAVWRDRRRGALTRLRQTPPHRWLGRLPSTRLRRGIVLGVLVTAALAPPITLVLTGLDLGTLSRTEFTAFKAGFAVALGAVVTPLVALSAMTDRLHNAPYDPAR